MLLDFTDKPMISPEEYPGTLAIRVIEPIGSDVCGVQKGFDFSSEDGEKLTPESRVGDVATYVIRRPKKITDESLWHPYQATTWVNRGSVQYSLTYPFSLIEHHTNWSISVYYNGSGFVLVLPGYTTTDM